MSNKSREQVSASEVPDDIRAMIEDGNSYSKNYYPSELDEAQAIYDAANNYYYGFNGYQQNKSKAKGLYLKAADKGLWKAKNQLKNLYGYDY